MSGELIGVTGLLIGFALIVFAIYSYFFPVMIAKKHKLPIFILCLFFGWSLVGWVMALIWALTTRE